MTAAEITAGAIAGAPAPRIEPEPVDREGAPLTRNERLDRLPFNKAHRRLLVASGVGWAFDAMDVGLVSFVVTAIAADPHFNLNAMQKSWVLSIGFIGMAIGAALGGWFADRWGRKTVFTATMIVFGVANGAMAFSWTLGMLLAARFVIGLGLGAERSVRYFEAASGVRPVASAKAVKLPKIRTRELFGRKYLPITLAIWATWFFVNFSYYGAFTWMPSLLADQFGSLTKSFGYTLAISLAQLPGYFLAAWLVERWGRRTTLSVFLAVSAVAAFLFSQSSTVTAVLCFGMLLSASNLGAWGVLYAVTPEIYPTRLRGAAAGAAAACGRVAAIVAPLLVPWFLTLSGGNKSIAFIVFAASFVFACVAALFLPERTGASLDD